MPRPPFVVNFEAGRQAKLQNAAANMSIYSSKRKIRKHSRSQLGHLKLSAYEESSALIVHIFEARGLLRRDGGHLDVYVKLYMLPDPQKSSKRKTKVVRELDPVINQRFTFLLSEKDHEKRLFVSVWTPHITSRNEMIGCMSFLVADLVGVNKGLNGWYQLLDEEKGRTESQQVPSSISASLSTAMQRPGTVDFAVTLPRSEDGYGFDVCGHNPVYVARVEHGLPAHQAEIMVGDVVVEVDRTDVMKADAELVQNLIMKGGDTLHLILHRDTNSQTRLKSSASSFSSSLGDPHQNLSRSHISIPSSFSHGTLSQDVHSFPYQRHTEYASTSHLPHERRFSNPLPQFDVLSQPADLSSFSYNPQDQFLHEAVRLRHSERAKRKSAVPRITIEEGEEGGGGGESAFQRQALRQTVSGELVPKEDRRRWRRRRRSEEQFNPLPGSYSTLPSPPRHEFSFSQPGEPEMKTYLTSHVSPAHRHTHHWRDNYSLTQGRAGAGRVEKDAMTGEPWQGGRAHSFSPNRHHYHGNTGHQQKFVGGAYRIHDNGLVPHGNGTGVRAGTRRGSGDHSKSREEKGPVDWEGLSIPVQKRQKVLHALEKAESTFCTELRNGVETYLEPLWKIISDSTHKTIFFNLKELSQVSNDVMSQLADRRLQYVGGASQGATPHYITHVADIYHSKLPEILELMGGYLENLHQAKQELSLAFTKEEFITLVQRSVVEGKKRSIYAFVEAGKDYMPRLFKGLLGVYHYTPPSHTDQCYLGTSLRALAKICPDKEIVARWEREQRTMHNLEVCVGFGPKLQKIPIAVPGRLLLLEGGASLIEKRRKRKVWLLLFSDILLLTQRQGKLLTCLESAIPLACLTAEDFNCSEDTEFQITTTDGSLIRLFRMPSASEKEKWMEVLRERATGSLAHRRRPAGEKSRVHQLPRLEPSSRLPPRPPLPSTADAATASAAGTAETFLTVPDTHTGMRPKAATLGGHGTRKEGSGDMDEVKAHRRHSQQLGQAEQDPTQLYRATSKRRFLPDQPASADAKL